MITEAVREEAGWRLVAGPQTAAQRLAAKDREGALAGLLDLIAAAPSALFALDFPFSIHRALIAEPDWPAFVAGFAAAHPSPDQFRAWARARAGGAEPKRLADRAAGTPWCAWNLRLYRQTWTGIAKLLAPAVAADLARAPPMQAEHVEKPTLAEICPASTLRALGLYAAPYKRAGADDVRAAMARALARKVGLKLSKRALGIAATDAAGDALDSLAALAGGVRAMAVGERAPAEAGVEGWVYGAFPEAPRPGRVAR